MMHTVKQLKEEAGLMSCLFEHEVKESTAKFEWTGPKLNANPDLWPQVLSFLRHVHEKHRGESQLRLYVNRTSGIWGAYAHPQVVQSGLHTKTLDIKETEAQTIARCSLMGDPDPANWIYWGTVHSHCSIGAGQSSTDEADEVKDGTGLHITIGRMDDKDRWDIHARIYVSKLKLEMKLDWFWEAGDEIISSIPKAALPYLRADIRESIARDQMTTPPPATVEFPAQWKENLIEKKVEERPTWTPYTPGQYNPTAGVYSPALREPHDFTLDVRTAVDELEEWAEENKAILDADIFEVLISIKAEAPFIVELLECCYRNDVSLDALINELEDEQRAELTQDNGKKYNQLGLPEHTGIPDYEGYGY